MPYKEKKLDKKYYSIREVADFLDVSPSLLRFWEQTFKNPIPKKNKKGDRRYTKKDIDKLRYIHHLVRERKYTLSGAKHVLRKGDAPPVASLGEVKATLLQLKSFLQNLDQLLEDAMVRVRQ